MFLKEIMLVKDVRRQSNGAFTCGGFLAELDHLTQTDSGRWEACIVTNGLH